MRPRSRVSCPLLRREPLQPEITSHGLLLRVQGSLVSSLGLSCAECRRPRIRTGHQAFAAVISRADANGRVRATDAICVATFDPSRGCRFRPMLRGSIAISAVPLRVMCGGSRRLVRLFGLVSHHHLGDRAIAGSRRDPRRSTRLAWPLATNPRREPVPGVRGGSATRRRGAVSGSSATRVGSVRCKVLLSSRVYSSRLYAGLESGVQPG